MHFFIWISYDNWIIKELKFLIDVALQMVTPMNQVMILFFFTHSNSLIKGVYNLEKRKF